MKRTILYLTLLLLLPIFSFSQVVKHKEKFTDVFVINDKVAFVKEIPTKKELSDEANYKILKSWAAVNYGKDHFSSSIRYNNKEKEFTSKSKVELLLPANSEGERKKMIMSYLINGFIKNDKCILEISEISYQYKGVKLKKIISNPIPAENFITNQETEIADQLQELKINTKKSTLYFLNILADDLAEKFGY